MNCNDCRNQLSAYFDGALAPAEHAVVEEHLKTCGACRQQLSSLQTTVGALQAMTAPKVPDLLPGIHARLETAAKSQPAPIRRPMLMPWHSLALAATALLVVVIAGLPQIMRLSPARRPLAVDERGDSDYIPSQPVAQQSGRYEPYYTTSRLDTESKATSLEERFRNTQALGLEKRKAPVPAAPPVMGDALANKSLDRLQTLAGTLGGRYAAQEEEALSNGLGGRELAQNEPLGVAEVAPENKGTVRGKAVLGKDDLKKESTKKFTSAPALMQLIWNVADVRATAAQIMVWATEHGGFAAVTSDTHLSVMLPAGAVASFIEAFTHTPAGPLEFDPASGWVSLSLELVETR